MLMTVQSQMFQKRLRLNFNRNVYARRQIQFLQFVHCLCGWLDDVEQPFVSANFKLFHRFLVHVRRTIHSELLNQRRQWNRSGHARASAFGSVHNLHRGLVEHAVIERLQANANALAIAHFASF